jgi:hypothetical protein
MPLKQFPQVMALFLIVAGIALSQPMQVKIRFEVDGKSRSAPRLVEFYAIDGRLLARQEIRNGTFGVPDKVTAENVNVVVRFAGRTMTFKSIPSETFRAAWTIGVDTPPFDDENSSSSLAANKPKEFWYIDFHYANRDGGRHVIAIPRQ